MGTPHDPFGIFSQWDGIGYFQLAKLPGIERLPYSIRVLLESVISRLGKDPYTEDQVLSLIHI